MVATLSTTKTFGVSGSFTALVRHINTLLARAGCERRIYECGAHDYYAFIARTPQQVAELRAAGVEGIQEALT